MLSDPEARVALKELIEKYLKGRDPDYKQVANITRPARRQTRQTFFQTSA